MIRAVEKENQFLNGERLSKSMRLFRLSFSFRIGIFVIGSNPPCILARGVEDKGVTIQVFWRMSHKKYPLLLDNDVKGLDVEEDLLLGKIAERHMPCNHQLNPSGNIRGSCVYTPVGGAGDRVLTMPDPGLLDTGEVNARFM